MRLDDRESTTIDIIIILRYKNAFCYSVQKQSAKDVSRNNDITRESLKEKLVIIQTNNILKCTKIY